MLELRATNLLHQPGVTGVVLNYRDVTERKGLEERLVRQASHDALSGLPNRVLLLERQQFVHSLHQCRPYRRRNRRLAFRDGNQNRDHFARARALRHVGLKMPLAAPERNGASVGYARPTAPCR